MFVREVLLYQHYLYISSHPINIWFLRCKFMSDARIPKKQPEPEIVEWVKDEIRRGEEISIIKQSLRLVNIDDSFVDDLIISDKKLGKIVKKNKDVKADDLKNNEREIDKKINALSKEVEKNIEKEFGKIYESEVLNIPKPGKNKVEEKHKDKEKKSRFNFSLFSRTKQSDRHYKETPKPEVLEKPPKKPSEKETETPEKQEKEKKPFIESLKEHKGLLIASIIVGILIIISIILSIYAEYSVQFLMEKNILK